MSHLNAKHVFIHQKMLQTYLKILEVRVIIIIAYQAIGLVCMNQNNTKWKSIKLVVSTIQRIEQFVYWEPPYIVCLCPFLFYHKCRPKFVNKVIGWFRDCMVKRLLKDPFALITQAIKTLCAFQETLRSVLRIF